MKIGVLVSIICFAVVASVSAQSKTSKLRLVSEVNDWKSGFVYLDGKLVTLMRGGKSWEIELPNRLLDPIIPKNVEVAMCDMSFIQSIQIIPPPPPWAMSKFTAGADAITPEFVHSEPVPFEVNERVVGILTFLESERHPDLPNMRIKLIEWIKQTNNLIVACTSPISLTSPLPNTKTQTLYIRGSRTNGYRLEK